MKTLAQLVFLLITGLTGCVGPAASPSLESQYQELAMQSENEIKLADATGFLWSNTEKFLEESRQAHTAGDLEKAVKLAKKARDEAVLAQKQAGANADPKPDYTFKK